MCEPWLLVTILSLHFCLQAPRPATSAFVGPARSLRRHWPHPIGRLRVSLTRTTNAASAASCTTDAVGEPRSEILDVLYPPPDSEGSALDVTSVGRAGVASYSQRVQAGRAAQGLLTSDPYAARTIVPARELTYGEFDLDFFSSLVEECLRIRTGGDMPDIGALASTARALSFGDIGSGCGRLVVAQALSWPWHECRGVEKVPDLHNMGRAALTRIRQLTEESGVLSSDARRLLEGISPCTLSLGDVNDEVDISDLDVLFCYSSTFPAFGDVLTEFSYTLGTELRPGAQVITTDRRLVSDGPWEFALLGEREGPNPETGGKSIAYLWEVVRSAL